VDEQYWEQVEFDYKGHAHCYHYVEITADDEVQRIMISAQQNVTELGYWRVVATGLSLLVDKLRAEIAKARLGKGVL